MSLGIVFALCTSLCWAWGNVMIQKSGRSLGTVRATLWALVVGAIAAGTLSVLLGEVRGPLAGRDLAWTALAGVSGLLAYGCMFHAFEHSPLTLAVPIVSSWSLVAGVLSFTAFGERPRPLALAGAAIVFTGVLLVSLAGGPRDEARPRGRKGLLVALGAALGFGVMIPVSTRVGAVWGPLRGTAVVYGLVVALGLPLALAARLNVRPPPLRQLSVWWLVLATGTTEALGFVCVALARRYAPMTVVTPVASLGATLTVLYAWVVLAERPPRVAAAGAGLACLGVVVLSL